MQKNTEMKVKEIIKSQKTQIHNCEKTQKV